MGKVHDCLLNEEACRSGFKSNRGETMRNVYILIILIHALILSPCPASGDTIHVPEDQPTIQAGIDAAVDGDLVLVAPGTYVENIDFLGKAIAVQSEDGADVTIIDGNQEGSVVIFISGETEYSSILGFTISNGNGSPYGYSKYSGDELLFQTKIQGSYISNTVWAMG